MLISGEIEKIIFRNADNGYTVLDINNGGEFFTAVGIFPDVYEGARVELSGDYKFHARHGLQFLADNVKIIPPDNAQNIEKYLKSGLFQGIGEVTAKNIIERFGDGTLEIMQNHPEQLAAVKGISKKRAVAIGENFKAQRDMQTAIIFLQNFEISLNMAIKIYKKYGDRTEDVIRENPYQLISDIERVGFVTADKIAISEGIERDSDFRIKAAVIYTLKEASGKNGHTCLPEELLIKEVLKLLEFGDDMQLRVLSLIDDLLFLSELKENVFAGTRFLMLYPVYQTERTIAKRLIRIKQCHNTVETDYEKDIKVFEQVHGVTLHQKQRDAVNEALNDGVHIITGGPGTGKTTIIKCILHILKSLRLSYQLCAPTGRAAKRMSEATGEESKTIHRLLDLDFKDGKGYFTYNENTRLPVDVVIVDEVSMVDEYVFVSLLKAVNDGSSVILVGDKDQLASVGAGNVLADIISSNTFGITYLDKIYRQSEDSRIITNAHNINNGKMPVLDNKSKDFFYVNKTEPSEIATAIIDLVTSRLPKYLNSDYKDVQVLCPMKKGLAGVIALNKLLRDKLNPSDSPAADLVCGEYTFREGDKVMQTVNSYEQDWVEIIDGREHTGRGIFNGEIGFIQVIDRQNMKFSVRFDDNKVAVYSFGDIDQLVPAYAVSVHKSQGSEFSAVVLALPVGNYFIMTRNLLYTAVTRAKDLVVIVGAEEVVQKMIKNNYTAKRFTLLTAFVLEEYRTNE